MIATDRYTFYAPGYADFAAAYVFGKSLRKIPTPLDIPAIWMAVGHGGMYDFQRNGQIFIREYTYVSNYAVGIVLNGAGYYLAKIKAVASELHVDFIVIMEIKNRLVLELMSGVPLKGGVRDDLW